MTVFSVELLPLLCLTVSFLFFFNYPATTAIYTLSLHDALPISARTITRLESPESVGQEAARRTLRRLGARKVATTRVPVIFDQRSEEHTSELQSHLNLVCRLLLEKKKKSTIRPNDATQH